MDFEIWICEWIKVWKWFKSWRWVVLITKSLIFWSKMNILLYWYKTIIFIAMKLLLLLLFSKIPILVFLSKYVNVIFGTYPTLNYFKFYFIFNTQILNQITTNKTHHVSNKIKKINISMFSFHLWPKLIIDI